MQSDRNTTLRRLAYLLLAFFALSISGCLAVGAGVLGGGLAGYAYYEGNVKRYFAANMNDVRSATRKALADLGMSVSEEKQEKDEYFFESRTGDGERVRVYVEEQKMRVPADGPMTQVGIRVATFGDLRISERILDQIGTHLVPATAGPIRPIPSAPGANATGLASPQAPGGAGASQSNPPPLLPAEPVPQKK